jgi:iron(III) transport system ATP-binding protein
MADHPSTGSTSEPAPISIRGITKSFGADPVLKGVSLEVAPGELVALLGPSGCGKTTLLRILAGLETPDDGEIVVRATTLTSRSVHVAPERRQVGMVFQDWALFPHLTVAKNVAYGLGRDTDRAARVCDALAMVELDGLDDRLPSTLSGGQQQRVALARAIAPQPDVLLLDEPFSNLDTALRVQVRADLHRLLVDLGITTVFVTHDQEEAFVLGDRVAVMNEGHVLQAATPAEIYRHPADRWVASFVGEANFLPATATSAADPHARTVLGDLPVATASHGGSAFDVLIRPEDLDLEPGGTAQIDLVEFYGHDTVYVVRVDDTTTLRVRAGAAPRFARLDRVTVRYTGPAVVAYANDGGSPAPSVSEGGDRGVAHEATTSVHAVEAGMDPSGEAVTDR